MFLLGHLGIGERLGRPFTSESSRNALFLGCVLPDLVDKPLYYGLHFATGKSGAELGLISSTRTIGHSLLFAILCYAMVRGPRGWALFVGMLTHLFLDLGGDLYALIVSLLGHPVSPPHGGPPTIAAVLFPLLGPHFPLLPFHSIKEHLGSLGNGYVIGGEILGASFLFLDWRARKRKKKMLTAGARK